MIKILPTTASGLSATTYGVDLPDVPVSLHTERPVSVSRTISGGAAVSSWAKDVAGTSIPIECVVSDATRTKLLAIDGSSATTWVLILQGRTFSATVDLASCIPERRFSVQQWRVRVLVVLMEELHR